MNQPNEPIQNLLKKGVSQIINEKSLREKLQSGKKLRIKFGIDPTAPIVHIGHAVPILKLRAFQELGHHIIILIGDATAQVGDSSDKDAERPMLAREETKKNAERYLEQFGQIIDISKVEVYYNSTGLDKVNFCGVGELAKHFSVAEMLDRDNFSKRYKAGKRISLQEFLYPLMQWYDSVALKADVELGGNDQYFNLLAGRTLQEAFGQPKQDIMMFHLIPGTDGRKMSKTYKNYIALNESANDMFVKVMAITDDLIGVYFEHCTTLTLAEIEPYLERLKNGEHPKNIKLELSRIITELYHGKEAAANAQKYFESVIANGETPKEEDIVTVTLEGKEHQLFVLIKQAEFFKTSGEAKDAILGGGVKVNNEVLNDPTKIIVLDTETKTLLQVGKKRFKNVVCGKSL